MTEYLINLDEAEDLIFDPETYTDGEIYFNDEINLLKLPLLTTYRDYSVGETVLYLRQTEFIIQDFVKLSSEYKYDYPAGTIVARVNSSGFMLWEAMSKKS